jgi:hypothetical protein
MEAARTDAGAEQVGTGCAARRAILCPGVASSLQLGRLSRQARRQQI